MSDDFEEDREFSKSFEVVPLAVAAMFQNRDRIVRCMNDPRSSSGAVKTTPTIPAA